MRVFILLLAAVAAASAHYRVCPGQKNGTDPVADQLQLYKEKIKHPAVLTTSAGCPVSYSQAYSMLNTNLINNEHFMDMMSHLVRERVPERTVHALGTGAHGYFEITDDILSKYCKADFLKLGKKTKVTIRFSTSAGSRGSNELTMDTRGWGMKFYTEEGNMDMAGFNTPVFSFKDPAKAVTIIRTSRVNPATNALDPTMLWDKFTQVPESLHMMLYVHSGHGMPASYREMAGFPIHTYQLVNALGEQYFCRFQYWPDAGVRNMDMDEARRLAYDNPNYYSKDLYRAIASGNYPTWTACAQILSREDLIELGESEAADVTRIIPEDKYPCHKFGKLVLNRNPKNFFAEIDQMAVCPCNTVPGILGGIDKLHEARRMVYRDGQIYRSGGNKNTILANAPLRANTYHRDGMPPLGNNGDDGPNYDLNSFNGPRPYIEECGSSSTLINIFEKEADNFDQAGAYYESMTPEVKNILHKTLLKQLTPVMPLIRERAVKLYYDIHPDLGERLARELNSTLCPN